jgi:hypothetical protein
MSLTSILFGCTYEPDTHYINPAILPPPAQIPAVINIDDVQGEFPLVMPTYFRVAVDKAGRSLVYFKVYKDGKEIDLITPSHSEQFIFLLEPTQLNNGTHEYDIEVKLASGSGSLAEAAGLEYYIVEKKLVVTVDNSTPAAITGLAATMVNGHMTIRWNKPAHQHYFYTIIGYNETDEYSRAVDISDSDVTQYIDEGFLGGKVSYKVVLRSAFFYVESEPVTFDFDPIEVLSLTDADNRFKLKWTMHYTFADDVFIRITGRHFQLDFPAADGETPVDTLYLGDLANTTLKLLRNGFETDGRTFSFASLVGDKIKPFDQYALVQSSNKLILHQATNSNKTYRYNATTFALEDSIYIPGLDGYNLLSSQNGNHQYVYSGNYLISFNPLNFSVVPTPVDLNDIYRSSFQRDLEYPGYYAVSNNNLLVLSNQPFDGQQIEHKIVTMDLNTKQLWGTQKEGTRAVIPANAEFMVVTNSISESDAVVYKRGATDWQEIGKVPDGEMFFSADGNPLLISSRDGVTKVFDLTTTPNGAGYFPEKASGLVRATGFDVVNNRVLQETIDAKSISTISSYSLTDFSLLSTVSARVTNSYPGFNHFIVGGNQLVTSGFKKTIQ